MFQATLDFLKHHDKNRTHYLVGFDPNNGPPIGFAYKDNDAELLEWLAKHNGKYNLYFHVNPLSKPPQNHKSLKEDVPEVTHLHVDCDPREGRDPKEERAHFTQLLTAKLPKGVPPPSAINMSGNGLQAFWRLEAPIPKEQGEALNLALAEALDADTACANADRVMRLPGTLNVPTAAKLKKGRTAVPAVAVDASAATYTPAAFGTHSSGSPAPKAKARKSEDPEVNDCLQPIPVEDINKLKPKLSARTRIVVVQGTHPEKPKIGGDASRSGWLFDAVCNLIREKVSYGHILGILLDKGFAISESVLENKNPKKYALRQIRRAKTFVGEIDWHLNAKKSIDTFDPRNIQRALTIMGVEIAYDEFARKMMIEGLPNFGPVINDDAVTRLRMRMKTVCGFLPTKDFTNEALRDIALDNRYHPVRDYLDGQTWDGVPRIDEWLIKYGGAEDNEYMRAISSIYLMAAVRRIREPGCKYDEIVVLTSKQGYLKSSAIKALCYDQNWFSDSVDLSADPKIFIEQTQGKWHVEIQEMRGQRRGDEEKVKANLSRQVDESRLAFGRLTESVPRSYVFIGTSNLEDYLKDTTGNRRYWPVKINNVFDLEAIKRDRDQLWAEARYREAQGESIRLHPSLYEAAAKEQAKFQEEDPWQEPLEAMFEAWPNAKVKVNCVLLALERTPDKATAADMKRVRAVMARLGFKKGVQKMDGKAANVVQRGDPPKMVEVYCNKSGHLNERRSSKYKDEPF